MSARAFIPIAIRQFVVVRARGRCEYCLVHQDDRPEAHQLDHIIALKHDGQTIPENLALACAICNNNKGSDFATIDWATETIVPLFNPRRQQWSDHFRLEGVEIIGITSTGLATAKLLRLNEPDRLLFRQALLAAGLYPPTN